MNAAAAEKPKRGLGRGLDALFADAEQRIEGREEKIETISTVSHLPSSVSETRRNISITSLIPAPYQPRRYFDPGALQGLSESIAQYGVLQPLLVRPSPTQKDKFEIIGGERRWRAAQLAQLHEVPVIVHDLDDRSALEIALIENIQRSDLTAIEEAEGYQKLIDEFQHTQEQLGDIVGKSRSHVTNSLRLLSLPKSVRDQIHQGKLTAGHARQLIGLSDAEILSLTKEIIEEGLSVREIERRRQKINQEEKGIAPRKITSSGKRNIIEKDADILILEKEMGNLLGLKVEINSRDNISGQVTIGFSSLDQLDELLQKLTRAAKS